MDNHNIECGEAAKCMNRVIELPALLDVDTPFYGFSSVYEY